VLTKQQLAKKFASRARTWERAYQHPGSGVLGKAYVVFLNPRLLSDSEFWKILNVGDSVWEQIVKKSLQPVNLALLSRNQMECCAVE
jgi:hypothetical protein